MRCKTLQPFATVIYCLCLGCNYGDTSPEVMESKRLTDESVMQILEDAGSGRELDVPTTSRGNTTILGKEYWLTIRITPTEDSMLSLADRHVARMTVRRAASEVFENCEADEKFDERFILETFRRFIPLANQELQKRGKYASFEISLEEIKNKP